MQKKTGKKAPFLSYLFYLFAPYYGLSGQTGTFINFLEGGHTKHTQGRHSDYGWTKGQIFLPLLLKGRFLYSIPFERLTYLASKMRIKTFTVISQRDLSHYIYNVQKNFKLALTPFFSQCFLWHGELSSSFLFQNSPEYFPQNQPLLNLFFLFFPFFLS